MIIKVLAKDIKEARNDGLCEKSSSLFCPVARALKRIKPNDRIKVYVQHAYINDMPYLLPEKVTNFIKTFDKNGTVKPFSFKLDA